MADSGRHAPRTPPSGTAGDPSPGRPSNSSGTKARRPQIVTFLLLCFAALVASGLPLPWGLAALAFILPAYVVGIRDLFRAGRTRARAADFALLGLGLMLVSLLMMVATLRLAFYSSQAGYEHCMAAALTQEGRAACQAELSKSLPEFSELTP